MMTITTKIEFTLKPFMVPNFVIIEKPIVNPDISMDDKLSLQDIDAVALDRLCNEFRDAIFKKAGKQQPARSNEQ